METVEARSASFPSLGDDGLAAASAFLRDMRGPGPEREQDSAALATALQRTADELGVVIGRQGALLVLARAFAVARRDAPALDAVALDADGSVRLAGTPAAAREELERSIARLFLTYLDLTSSLIGFDLVRPILRRVTESLGRN